MAMKLTALYVLSAIFSVSTAATVPAGVKAPGGPPIKISEECNAFECVSAYAGEIAACSAAASEGGLNVVADIACFSAISGAEAVAPVCEACIDEL